MDAQLLSPRMRSRIRTWFCRWGFHDWACPRRRGSDLVRTCRWCRLWQRGLTVGRAIWYVDVLEGVRDMSTITRSEANLMREFGFCYAKGGNSVQIPFGDILDVLPLDGGFEVLYRDHCPRRATRFSVVRVDIPRQELEDKWIFVYYDSLSHEDR